jgi:hypothetical protein
VDRLTPGALGTLKAFREKFEAPAPELTRELHRKVFGENGRPPLGLRRLKEDVAQELPSKVRRLHPGLMPKIQSDAYDVARVKLAESGAGGALKLLHHIRTVSVHPRMDAELGNDDFVNSSARLHHTFQILKRIKDKGERCLVFIEHRLMQFRFIELARAEFGLPEIGLINGDTPIAKRQAIGHCRFGVRPERLCQRARPGCWLGVAPELLRTRID